MGLETPMGELTPLGQRYGIDLVNVDNSAILPGGL